MNWRIQTYQIAGKDQSLNAHGRHQTGCKKRKRIRNPTTDYENIQSGQEWNLAEKNAPY